MCSDRVRDEYFGKYNRETIGAPFICDLLWQAFVKSTCSKVRQPEFESWPSPVVLDV